MIKFEFNHLSTMQNILELTNLRKYYATQKAVDDISFSIEKGSIFGLLGPNGAGKTTLLRMITGIFYPDSGHIQFDGRTFNPIEDVLKIGYMPEERGLYKKMKIGDQVMYLAQLKGLSRQDALKQIKFWFKRLEMESWWTKKVEDLSKGMSQKLQFVTTVLHEPQLIILDEPFSGLDPLNANLIKDEIYGLAQRGSTVIFSTHRMEQVEEICDHIVLMNLGKKILDGTVGDVKQQFKENKFSIKLQELPAHTSSPAFNVIDQQANAFTVKINEGHKSNDVLQFFLQQQCTIEAFQEILPSLNDIFIHLVEGSKAKTRQFNDSMAQ
ncbi:ABC-2 type transport system ATP-binding protein [Hydrobacter penzbergensis]|uniref:ABC-2 type transport system ATP-binding protein n=1 Tax=Hydrobacter penzbergensis TaxID=1235997 RepID=A0A8X8IDH7_9BACT|nr:ATP-binding cassette domain-containing protein [Hydrobacter penzbergensis]SDW34888.1 ABC-2 type transport system ATP-binding protein [Hydrobacter penzbergensis]